MTASKGPFIAEIKRNSLDDGPGIRSVVFFKGCPLRCTWCHNPECLRPGPEILFRPEPCIGCRSCVEACPEGAIGSEGPGFLDRGRCTLCGECADECPSGALELVGKAYTPDELVDLLARDKAFYDNSGGGVTLSGGEPTMSMDYSAEVSGKLGDKGIPVLVETCGDFKWETFAEKLLPRIHQVFVDIKFIDEDQHRRHTGRGNARIKENIQNLIRHSSSNTLVRIPLVPGVTATRGNLQAIAQWLRDRGIARVALLPYNPLWIAKAKGLGREPHYDRETWMSQEERDEVKRIFEGFELERDI